MNHDVLEMRIRWLRQRASRRRIVAEKLTRLSDAEIALEEARLAEAEASRLETQLTAQGTLH